MDFTAKGKLLLTGEYSVLKGALALSIPTTFEQTLQVSPEDSNVLHWRGFDDNENIWFSAVIDANGILETSDETKAKTLFKILNHACSLNPKFTFDGFQARTHLTFNRAWGLGSSSTLIALIAQWAEVDALKLFFGTLSGSGYDVATAYVGLPILYQLIDGNAFFKSVPFDPPFKDQLFFVYLGIKQDSAKEVQKFNPQKITENQLAAISNISKQLLEVETLDSFEDLLLEHEARTSILLDRPTVFEARFPDYPNVVKSLGAWGGDFILATGSEKNSQYFKDKGYHMILSWKEMIGI